MFDVDRYGGVDLLANVKFGVVGGVAVGVKTVFVAAYVLFGECGRDMPLSLSSSSLCLFVNGGGGGLVYGEGERVLCR